MKVSRKQLLDELDLVKSAVSSKELVEQQNAFLFTNGFLVGMNQSCVLSVETSLDIEGALYSNVADLISSMNESEIDLIISDESIQVKGKTLHAEISSKGSVTAELDSFIGDLDWLPVPDKFYFALSLCSASVSKETWKVVLSTIHINQSIIESCDNFRLTRVDLGKKAKRVFDECVLLPMTVVQSLFDSKIIPTEVCIDEHWVHFRNGLRRIALRRVDGTYPDLSSLVELKNPATQQIKVKDSKSVKEGLGRFAIFAEDGQEVSVSIDKAKMIVSLTTSKEKVSDSFSLDTKVEEPITFSVSPAFLQDLLDLSPEFSLLIVDDVRKYLRFEGDNYLHLVCLSGE